MTKTAATIPLPSVGRVVLYKVTDFAKDDQPLVERMAVITEVITDTKINIKVIHSADDRYIDDVEQGDDICQWQWMPYQVGQAAKTKELESKLQEEKEGNKDGK